MRYVVGISLGSLLVALAACSATETSPGPTPTGVGGSGANSGGGGTGAATTGGGGTGAGTTGGTGGTGAGTTGGSGGSGGMICPLGAIICDGDTMRVCDGNGSYSTEQACAPQICVPNLGCVDCVPGEGTCNGDVSEVCAPDGMGITTVVCDPVQGVSCNANSGLCEGVCAPQNLEQSYVGCDYYPTVTTNIVAASFHYAVAVANTTPSAANVIVTQGASTVTTTTVAAGALEIIHLPWHNGLKAMGASIVAADGAYRLRSDQPVVVYQYSPIEYSLGGYSYTNDASLLLPVNAWSGTYRVASRNHWRSSIWSYPGIYAVVASEDDTTVTLTPSGSGGIVAAGGGVAANGTGTIVLNAGDVLQVSTSPAGGATPDASDLTGTLIEADKPIEVIGGHSCTFVPNDIGYCDHLEESMYPLETLADEYLVTPPLIPTGGSTPKAQMVRVIATAPNTTVTYDPPQGGAPTSLANAGDYFEIAQTAADFLISTSEKVIVAQYMLGQDAGGGSGDPAMTLAVATAQYRTDYLFHAPTNYQTSYLNITAPTGATVTLDGTAVAAASFAPIGGSGYSIARVSLSNAGNGNHTISSPLPFGISVYGYGQYTSYWYPGGLDLTPLGL